MVIGTAMFPDPSLSKDWYQTIVQHACEECAHQGSDGDRAIVLWHERVPRFEENVQLCSLPRGWRGSQGLDDVIAKAQQCSLQGLTIVLEHLS